MLPPISTRLFDLAKAWQQVIDAPFRLRELFTVRAVRRERVESSVQGLDALLRVAVERQQWISLDQRSERLALLLLGCQVLVIRDWLRQVIPW